MGRGGFTLLEIMIALAILGSSLVLLLTSVFHSVKMFRVAQETLVAGFLSQEKFTEVINAKSSISIGDSKDGIFEKAPAYSWSYRIDKVGLPPFMDTIPGLKRIEVVVGWDSDRHRHIEIISYLRDQEPRSFGQ